MWPNYYLIEARRLANDRDLDADRAELIRQAGLYRLANPTLEPNALRRTAARLALATGGAWLRLARRLDECVADGAGASTGATPVG